MHHYKVYYVIHSTELYYRQNRSYSVIAMDVIEAAQAVMKLEPEAKITSISHHGKVDKILETVREENESK